MTDRERDSAIRWIAGPGVGISSKTIWCVMMGVPCDDPYTPSDPDDFSRCWTLLTLIPSWRQRLGEVVRKYPAWDALVREWDTLTKMYEECIASGKRDRDLYRAMYEYMQPLLAEGRSSR